MKYMYNDVNQDYINSNHCKSISVGKAVNNEIDKDDVGIWSMFAHDTKNTGRSTYDTDFLVGRKIWGHYNDVHITETPVIDSNGIIYYPSVGELIALYPNGDFKWSKRFATSTWGSSPAIGDDGIIYAAAWTGHLYAFNTENGELIWECPCGGSISSSPAIGDDGTIYLGTFQDSNDEAWICAVNPNGTLKWRYMVDNHIISDPAIGDDGTIYIGSGDSYFYAMNSNGSLKWCFKTGSEVRGSPSIADDGTVYIFSADHFLYALNPDDGSVFWQTQLSSGYEGAPAIGSDGTIYMGGHEFIYAINPDGSIKWEFDLGEGNYVHKSSIALSNNDILYVGLHSSGEIISLNPDGTLRWREVISNDEVQSSPSIGSDGIVYIGTYENSIVDGQSYGFLYAFNEGRENQAPSAPIIEGNVNSKPGNTDIYSFTSVDPEGDDIYYYISIELRSGGMRKGHAYGPFPSGYVFNISHQWEIGDYQAYRDVRALAFDTFGDEGDMSTLEVAVPKAKPFQMLIQQFLENHPIIHQILRLFSTF